MDFTHDYEVTVAWTTVNLGEMSSPQLNTAIDVATPPPFPNGIEGVWSPEHLLVAAVNSCLMTTFLSIARSSKLEFEEYKCKAVGKLEKVDGKYMISEIRLEPTLTILNNDSKEKAERLLQKAEAACLISNSVKSRVMVNPIIRIGVVKAGDLST